MPTCQGQHPDGSPCRNPAPPGQIHCYIHWRPDPSARLTREDVLEAIKEHGGPEGLDLSHEDLAGIELGREAIQEELRKRGLDDAPWRSQYAKGAYLLEADLHGADLSQGDLQGSHLSCADLQGADLSQAILQGAWLMEADLRAADLQGADLSDADLSDADLRGAKFQDARLERVDLTAAEDITCIRWYGAVLDKTRLRREQLGEKIGDELTAEKGDGTYDQAREAYLALKTNFNELGRYDDASWAYRQERRMERAMSWPGRAAREHPKETNRLAEKHRRVGKPWFYIKHTLKWLWDGAVALLTDYGESPGRVLAWAALLLLVAYPLIYWWCAGRPAPAGNLLAFVKDYLLLSLGAFSTLDLVDLSAARFSNWTRLWAATEAMAGISLLALLMFTLGNRISRS